jgi:hypothetical protein
MIMKKIYFLIVWFGALLFCACEKENIDPLGEDLVQSRVEERALKGAKSNGHLQTEFVSPIGQDGRRGCCK